MKSKFLFEVGEIVRIKSGPFQAFTGRVEDVDNSSWKLKVMVSIFGRHQPVELGFIDVEKLTFEEDDN